MTVTLAPADAGVEIGTFFVQSWGYDATLITFYKVVGLTPKGVRVQKWETKTVRDDGGPVTYVTAGDRPHQETVWPRAGLDTCERGCTDDHDARRTCPDHKPRGVDAAVQTKRLSGYAEPTNLSDNWRAWISVADGHDRACLWDGEERYQTGCGWI